MRRVVPFPRQGERPLIKCTEAQWDALLEFMRRVDIKYPRRRAPALDLNDRGELLVAFSYQDMPTTTFTMAILTDGRVEWFFRDDTRADAPILAGTPDEPEPCVPDAAIELLAVFA